MAVYPSTLPRLDIVGVASFAGAQNTLRTSMAQGPDKVRRRSTAAPRPATMGHPGFTSEQMRAFFTFYETTTKHGALPFDMDDPIAGEVRSFRFTGPPEADPVGAAYWSITVPLEVLPA